MIPRSVYISNRCTHEEYYAQFVTDAVLELVAECVGLTTLRASGDQEFFNDIPLAKWDALWLALPPKEQLHLVTLAREADGGVSPAFKVCVFKAAARKLIGGAS